MTYELFKESLLKELEKMDATCTYTTKLLPLENRTGEFLIGGKRMPPSAALDLCGLYQQFLKNKDYDVLPVARMFHSYIRLTEIQNTDRINFEDVKDYICCRLVNPRKRPDLMEKTPTVPYLDLAVTFYIDFGIWEDILERTCVLSKASLTQWDITLEDLYTLAKKNTIRWNLPKIIPAKQLIPEMETLHSAPLLAKVLKQSENRYLITNDKERYGTTALLFPEVLEHITQISGCDLYLLLISEHEIAVESATESLSNLQRISRNIYKDPSMDALSDTVYCYRKGSGRVSVCFHTDYLKNL